MIHTSNINELLEALTSFAKSYREESTSALEARVKLLVASAGEQAAYEVRLANMNHDEQLAAMETEKKHFESVSYEIEEKVGAIKRQLQSDQRKVQSFATTTARKYSEKLRHDIYQQVDQGIVDGELLSNAFTDYQSQYATEAMDEVHEKFEAIWEELKSKLEELDDVLQQEDLHSPEAGAFNKAQAFKWEKGIDASFKIGGAIGSAIAFAAIGGPAGFAAALGIGLAGSLFGWALRKAVVKYRGNQAKRELEPPIKDFKSSITKVINDSFSEFADTICNRLNGYISARSEELDNIQRKITELKENGVTIHRQIDVLENERDYLMNWRPDNG